MKTLIIYYSKTGFTRRYAQWLGEELSCDCIPFAKRKTADFSQYGAVVYGAGCHAGSIRKLGWFLKKLPSLSSKRLAVFFTGAMPPDETAVAQTVEKNFTPEQLKQIKVFYLWGGLNYEEMGPVDRALMAGFRKMLRAKADAAPEEKEMLKMIESSYDKADRKYLKPLLEYLQ